VLTAPEELTEDAVAAALAGGWRLSPASVGYRPVGFGSHHWEVADTAGSRWFATADDLRHKQANLAEPLDRAFERLRAALGAAVDLRTCGRLFVVAPVPALDGEPVIRPWREFAIALYPFADGQSFGWGEFPNAAHRRAAADLVAAVHTAPAAASRRAMTETYAIAHLDELELALDQAGPARVSECGPFSRPVAALLHAHRAPVRALLARYGDLVAQARSSPPRAVLTHGEPHPGNTMLTAEGWRLIDWDTALVAPPERDLWLLGPRKDFVLTEYAEATGVRPVPAMLELYRLRWDIADLAVDVSRFGRPHQGSEEDEASWEILRGLVGRISCSGDRALPEHEA
jgi:spectinomycin phosphotransferase/16S rRNA (guanine(1405)-N(7))-methyltransferase